MVLYFIHKYMVVYWIAQFTIIMNNKLINLFVSNLSVKVR